MMAGKTEAFTGTVLNSVKYHSKAPSQYNVSRNKIVNL